MAGQFPHVHIPDGDYSGEVLASLEKMETECARLTKDSTIKEIGVVVEVLHPVYWQLVAQLVPMLLTTENKLDFSIDERYQNLIGYGYVSTALVRNAPASKVQKVIPLDPAEKKAILSEYQFFSLDTWLVHVHVKSLRLDQKAKLEERLHKAEEELRNYPKLLAECSQHRTEFVERNPRAARVMQISRDIDERLPVYTNIKEKIEMAVRITPQERTRYVALSEELAALRELRTREQLLISEHVPQHELMSIDRKMEGIIVNRNKLRKEVGDLQSALKKDEAWREELALSKCREMLREEVRTIRTMAELMGKRSRMRACSLLTNEETLPKPEEIITIIENILDVDPSLYSPQAAQRIPFPYIVIVPGAGNGIYDFEKKALLIPTRPIRGLFEAVTTALIEFYLDSPYGLGFRDAYSKLNKNKTVTSAIEMNERIQKDYISWITMEANGYQVLDQETRQFFMEKVAPALFALRHPRRASDFTVAFAHELLKQDDERTDKDRTDFEEQFKLGLATWRIGNYPRAVLAFRHALEANPESVDACYNLAMAFFRTGQKKHAVETWRKYLTLDKSSFWQLRVQKFLGTNR